MQAYVCRRHGFPSTPRGGAKREGYGITRTSTHARRGGAPPGGRTAAGGGAGGEGGGTTTKNEGGVERRVSLSYSKRRHTFSKPG